MPVKEVIKILESVFVYDNRPCIGSRKNWISIPEKIRQLKESI